MKTKQELLQMLFVILAELQHDSDFDILPEQVRTIQETKLQLLYDILGEEVPEEFWEQIEKELQ